MGLIFCMSIYFFIEFFSLNLKNVMMLSGSLLLLICNSIEVMVCIHFTVSVKWFLPPFIFLNDTSLTIINIEKREKKPKVHEIYTKSDRGEDQPAHLSISTRLTLHSVLITSNKRK